MAAWVDRVAVAARVIEAVFMAGRVVPVARVVVEVIVVMAKLRELPHMHVLMAE